MGARALVTGVTGQDGSYLAERLLADGWEVHGMVRPPEGDEEAIEGAADGVQVHVGDLADPGALERLVAATAPDVVYHLAGLSSVARSWEEPAVTAELTATPVARLLAACASSSAPPRVVLASSAEVFGGAVETPQSEQTPVRPVSPYGAAKAYVLQLGQVYRGAGLHVSSAVLYNHESPRRPPTFVTRKIAAGAVAIARGEQSELRLGNLDAVRDWGWAPDYVDAMVRMAAAEAPDDYVVASGRGHTVRDFVAAAFAAAGVAEWEQRVVVDPTFFRPVDSVDLVGDASKIRARLGWRPTVEFEDLVAALVEAERRAG